MRSVFKKYIYEAEFEGTVLELLSPIGLLEGVKDLSIDDLEEYEVAYLLKVLVKEEFGGVIMLSELLQIMENFGLYDDDEFDGNSGTE